MFTANYKNPLAFRISGDSLLKVNFIKEVGLDNGGMVKKFIVETLKEIPQQMTGLFIPMPSQKVYDPRALYKLQKAHWRTSI